MPEAKESDLSLPVPMGDSRVARATVSTLEVPVRHA